MNQVKQNGVSLQHNNNFAPHQPPVVALVDFQDQRQTVQSQQANGSELIGYYFGSISRETAEWILRTNGKQADGAYLLRSSGPNDNFVLSLLVNHNDGGHNNGINIQSNLEVLHYKIIETEDSFVALHGQVGDEKFATIDELIEKAQGVATKPRWPIHRHLLESQILPPTYWGLTVDQVRLAILIKAKQWGFPLLSSLNQNQQQPERTILQQIQQNPLGQLESCGPNLVNATTLNNETIRTLIYKSLHEFQPWFHGRISRDEAERRMEEVSHRDGRFLVRERDNYSYAMCISHKRTTKHYRIDVLPTGELAIQDGRKFTSLMALVSHYTIMSDGLWCALTEPCPRPIQPMDAASHLSASMMAPPIHLRNQQQHLVNKGTNGIQSTKYTPSLNQNIYCIPPMGTNGNFVPPIEALQNQLKPCDRTNGSQGGQHKMMSDSYSQDMGVHESKNNTLMCPNQGAVTSLKAPIKEWLQTINHKWSQLLANRSHHQPLNSFLFGTQNPLNNHCKHNSNRNHPNRHRKCKNGHIACGCAANQVPVLDRSDSSGRLRLSNAYTNYSSNRSGVLAARERNCNETLSVSENRKCCTNDLGQNCRQMLPLHDPNILHMSQNTYNLNSSSLLSTLPQNCGFHLDSQSFIGSPLFAVRQMQPETNMKGKLKASGSSTSGSGSANSYNNDDEKLISPAQSISGNLNNHYSVTGDIYGSQTSTAIIKDRMASSSSSHSGVPRSLTGLSSSVSAQQQPRLNSAATHMMPNNLPFNMRSSVAKATPQSGPIVCGQHAGPAFRYTNCHDENSLRRCVHRPQVTYRAADDSHLLTSSSSLVGPAAMGKFVQFQDGQCLRTHRDTKSIQLAYLSSRNRLQNVRSRFDHNSRPMEAEIEHSTGGGQNYRPNMGFGAKQTSHKEQRPAREMMTTNGQMPQPDASTKSTCNAEAGNNTIDLMDCGSGDFEGFDFKYDPKLIKSSSIETLCGPIEEEPIADLSNFKSNTELIMSLQSCWFPPAQPEALNILSPTVTSENSLPSGELLKENLNHVNNVTLGAEFTSSNEHNEQLDHMKKKHDLDELTTALLAELTASLKAQVDLKNKRSGLCYFGDVPKTMDQETVGRQSIETPISSFNETNPRELINEFDSLINKNN